MTTKRSGVLLSSLFLATLASAQDAKPANGTPAAPSAEPSQAAAALAVDPKLYEIQVQPRVWYVSLSGDLAMPGAPAGTADASLDELNLDSPQMGPYGDATLRFGRWTVNVSAMAVSGDRSTTAQRAGQIGGFTFNPGDPIRSSIDLASGEASAGYSLGTWDLGTRRDGTGGLVADLSVLGGVRMYDVSVGVGATTPDTTKADEFFAEPMVGGRLEMNFAKSFSIDLQSTVGWMPADRETMSWDIEVAFTWRPVKNLGLQLGYRNMRFDLSSGDGTNQFELNGGAAGLFAGVQLRF